MQKDEGWEHWTPESSDETALGWRRRVSTRAFPDVSGPHSYQSTQGHSDMLGFEKHTRTVIWEKVRTLSDKIDVLNTK